MVIYYIYRINLMNILNIKKEVGSMLNLIISRGNVNFRKVNKKINLSDNPISVYKDFRK